MMGSSKLHLKHLLSEAQEPFVLKKYITEKRSERAKPPLLETPRLSGALRRHSCLFSFPESPDMKKPSLFEFSSRFEATPKSVFVNISPETAALLLEAALRIERSQLERSRSVKKVGLGLFGSILKRLKRGKKDGKKTTSGQVEDSSDSWKDVCDSKVNTPDELLSAAASPAHRKSQVAKNDDEHLNSDGKEQKEEAEHFSPVSVLDVDIEGQDDEEQEDEDDSELERSFAFVQKTKLKLLRKLRRFERLAELNPLELDKRIAEDKDEESEDDASSTSEDSESSDTSNAEVLDVPNSSNRRKIPLDTKRLVIALMKDEGPLAKSRNKGLKSIKLRKRLSSLKNIERNTINMMVQMDFRTERNEWQKNSEDVEEIVVEVELAVFGFLVEELSAELVHSNSVY